MVSGWSEREGSTRRALAAALAALREALPHPPEAPNRLTRMTARRLAEALPARGGPLRAIVIPDAGPLDQVLAVYLAWVQTESDRGLPLPQPSSTLALQTAFGTPQAMHQVLIEAICVQIGMPIQDL